MKVLFIGGTGVISSACAALAVEQGLELYLLNRGVTSRPVPDGAVQLIGDIRNPEQVKAVLQDYKFDAVVDWIAFGPEHIQTDIELFSGKTDQFVFISSASVYQTPPSRLPVTEDTPLDNPFWQYSQDKIACEKLLMSEYKKSGFPITIVRPSHTYDKTMLPNRGKFTDIDRMLKGKPVVLQGDGTSIWTLTHHKDFAVGFNGLLGNSKAIGEAYHITSDEWLTWDQIMHILADTVNAKADIVHIPSDLLAAYFPDMGPGLLGDKSHSMIFDNSKIRELVPAFNPRISFREGAKEIIQWFNEVSERRALNQDYNEKMDRLIGIYKSIWPK